MYRFRNDTTESVLKVLQWINYKTIPLESMYSYNDDTQTRMDCELSIYCECESKKKV